MAKICPLVATTLPAGAAGVLEVSGSSAGVSSSFGAGAASPASVPLPSPSNSINGSPTSTVVSGSTNNFVTVPAYGDTISCTSLSFCTSATESSTLTVSPTLTNQFVISPSAIPSPISGIVKISVIVHNLLGLSNNIVSLHHPVIFCLSEWVYCIRCSYTANWCFQTQDKAL